MTHQPRKDGRLLVTIGSIGPIGHLPASGTASVAIVGIPVFWLTRGWPTSGYVICLAIFTFASVWLHQKGDRILNEKDSRKLVWDELAGFWLAVLALPWTWQIAVAAFLMERALDIAKIPPANVIEARWPGGWGVVFDDVVAGTYTCVAMHVLIHYFPAIFGLSA